MSLDLVFFVLRRLITLVFIALIVLLWARAIVSWLTPALLRPEHPIVRFLDRATAPMLEPLRKRLPSMALGMFDLSFTVGFIFALWVLGTLEFVISAALP